MGVSVKVLAVAADKAEPIRVVPTAVLGEQVTILGTQKRHKHKHFIGIALPYWASL